MVMEITRNMNAYVNRTTLAASSAAGDTVPSSAVPSETADQTQARPELATSSAKNADQSSSESTPDQVRKHVEKMNNQLSAANHSIRFSVDDDSSEVVVKVVDTETDEVIKQIPPKEIVRLREHLQDMTGVLVEETA